MNKILYIALAFILCFTCIMPVSYASSYIPLPDLPSENSLAFQFIYDGVYYTTIVVDGKNALSSATYNGSSTVKYRFNRDITMHEYKYVNDKWTLNNSMTQSSVSVYDLNTIAELVYSNVDVLNSDGTVFFPPAPPTELYQIIQEVTNQNLPQTQMTVVGAMKILVLCGVGCLALLMVFPLFGKILKPYLH